MLPATQHRGPRPRFLPFLLLLFLTSPVFAAGPPSGTDLPALIKEAAAYQPGQSVEPFRHLEELGRQSVADPAIRQQLEAGLVQLLAPWPSFEARRFACQQLSIIGSKTALPALAQLLVNGETVGLACLALTTYPPGQADEVLRNALAVANGAARIQIINTLGDRRDAHSVRLLARSARAADRDAAAAAVAALGKIGDAAARKEIAALRREGLPALAPALTEAALRCAEFQAAAGDRKGALATYEELLATAAATYVRRSALEALLRLDPDHRERRILAALHDLDSALKPVAIAAIRTLPAGMSSEPFAAELHRLSPAEQVWMIGSLATRNNIHATLAISVSLTSPHAEVRLAAVDALSQKGDPSFLSMLVRALTAAKSPAESRAIESALVVVPGGAQTDQTVTAALKRASGESRVGLIAVLARRAGADANPVFFAETENSDPLVAKAAFRALGRTAAPEDVPALLEALAKVRERDVRPDAESAAAQALAKVENASARSAALTNALARAQTVEARVSLLGLLPAAAGAASLAALNSAATDPEPRLRQAAVHALADWPDAAAWDTLAGLYRQPENETSRALALRALVRLAGEQNPHPDAALVERYRQLLAGARTVADVKLILGALGGANHPDTLQFAVQLLANPAIRPEAEAAVRKIAEAIKAQDPQAAQAALEQIQPK